MPRELRCINKYMCICNTHNKITFPITWNELRIRIITKINTVYTHSINSQLINKSDNQ